MAGYLMRMRMPTRLLAPALALACAMAQAGEAPRGSLVIIGGALRPDNAQVWEKLVELAGGRGARIAVFPSAAASPARSGEQAAHCLNRYGARAFVVPIAARLAGTDARKAAEDASIAASVRDAGGAFFVGGDQDRITSVLRRADGARSAVLDALWTMYRRGGVIAGTSAGAAIMSSTMFYDAQPVLPMLQDGVRDGKDIAPGLGFVGDDVFIDQHLLVRGRFARMLPVMLARHYRIGLGIDENTAMVVGPDREVRVIGYKGALLLDLSQAAADPAQPGFNVSNARISYLDSGDRYNIATGTLRPGPDKARLDGDKPEFRGPLFNADILGNTAVVDLIEKLADSDQQRAIGIAFGGPASRAPERGFEFIFSRTSESAAYQSTRSDACSVYRIRLDVRPIRMHQPLYGD